MRFTRDYPALALAFTLLWCAESLGNTEFAVGDGVIEMVSMSAGPQAPAGVANHIVDVVPQSAVMLAEVPTSGWSYGCSATSAGMIFGYYDRIGYSNMYAGPANGGVAPLTNLGDVCSIIATRQGFDGRSEPGHVDDYWVSSGSAGPDPWEGVRAEHTWGDCTADFMGTSQWKWDFIGSDGVIDFNVDGSTALTWLSSATKLYDYIPPASSGLPRTALCHGLRLFAESRGYEVLENYTQRIDTLYTSGFSFNDFVSEIDSGRPVMLQLTKHSMVGVGYDATTQTVYVHDTWGDYVGEMAWGGSYSDMALEAVTVLRLAPVPEPSTLALLGIGAVAILYCVRRRRG